MTATSNRSRFRLASLFLLLVYYAIGVESFAPSTISSHVRAKNYRRRHGSTLTPILPLSLSSSNQEKSETTLNGDSGGLVSLSDDGKSELFSAFAALELPDQYDAVLTGLCAKILDDTTIVDQAAVKSLSDPLQLLQEMNTKRIPASPRSLMALMDATVKAQDAKTMASVISLAKKNRMIKDYGSCMTEITNLPTTPTTRVKCPDGKVKTRTERLADVPAIPTDDRSKEVSSAFAFSALVVSCLVLDVAHFDDITPFTNLLLASVIALTVVDNFYDLITTLSSMAAKQLNDNKPRTASNFELPKKESLPLGLGSGAITGTVVRGLSRLLTVDAEREAQCEAAALFVAYQLGLPCFAFRPNALEGSVLVIESTREEELDSLDSSSGILRMLVWLLAPVAMESQKHSQLIMSDPREADGFLQRLEDYVRNGRGTLDSIWWLDDEQERADLLQWAYAEADLLLRSNRKVVTELSQILTGGAATIGDCVSVIERW